MTPSVRPVAADDLSRVRDFLDSLSVDTAFRRFLTGLGHPTLTLVRQLLRRGHDRGAFVAEHDGVVVGHVTWCRVESGAVEMAMVVADDWQHRGIGRALGSAAMAEAATHGATHVTMSVHAGNRDVIELVQHLWPEATLHHQDGLLVYDVALAA